MVVKQKQNSEPERTERKTFWQPPEQRTGVSEAGRRWQEENAEAIKSINEWVEKNGLPLAKYRMF
jgi:hypothetical protein